MKRQHSDQRAAGSEPVPLRPKIDHRRDRVCASGTDRFFEPWSFVVVGVKAFAVTGIVNLFKVTVSFFEDSDDAAKF